MLYDYNDTMDWSGADITALLGPPNAGKSTLTRNLPVELQRPIIGLGDIFREAIAAETELGLKVQPFVDGGTLVPMDLAFSCLTEALKDRISKGETALCFDGVPRNIEQAVEMKKRGIPISRVIVITVPDDEAEKRALNRRFCPRCKRTYSLTGPYSPAVPGLCDDCSHDLVIRKDDAEITKRLTVYHQQTEPLLEHLTADGVPVYTVDNSIDGSMDKFVEALTATI